MLQVEVNGTIYCDWRVTVYDCVDAEFFRPLVIVAFASNLLGFTAQFVGLLIEVFLKKTPFSRFLKGNHLFGLVAFVNSIFPIIQLALVLFSTYTPVTEFFFGLTLPTITVFLLFYLETLLDAVPHLKTISGGGSVGHISKRIRRGFCLSVGLLDISFNTTLFVFVAYYKSTGNWELWALCLEIALAFAAFCHMLSRETKKLNQTIPNQKTLAQVHATVSFIIGFNSVMNIPPILFFLLLAFKDNFFTDLNFSKGIAITQVVLGIVLAIFFVMLMLGQFKEVPPGQTSSAGSFSKSSQVEEVRISEFSQAEPTK